MTPEERAKIIRARMHQDMHVTLVSNGDLVAGIGEPVLDALADDAMFQVEHLLCEIEDLENELALTRRQVAQ